MSGQLKLSLVFKGVFIGGFLLYMGLGYRTSAQSLQQINEKVEIVRNVTNINAGKIGILEDRVARNSEDIRILTASNADLVASVNKFTGIGIAIGALGGVIVVLQSIQLLKKKEDVE